MSSNSIIIFKQKRLKVVEYTAISLAHFESNYSSYYSNYISIRTWIVATIVLLEINGGL